MPDRAGPVGTCFSLTLGPCSSSTTWGKVGTSRSRLGTMAMQGMVAGAHLADCRYERASPQPTDVHDRWRAIVGDLVGSSRRAHYLPSCGSGGSQVQILP